MLLRDPFHQWMILPFEVRCCQRASVPKCHHFIPCYVWSLENLHLGIFIRDYNGNKIALSHQHYTAFLIVGFFRPLSSKYLRISHIMHNFEYALINLRWKRRQQDTIAELFEHVVCFQFHPTLRIFAHL